MTNICIITILIMSICVQVSFNGDCKANPKGNQTDIKLAQKAAKEAKAAQEAQKSAGQQASAKAKDRLAEAAVHAADAAEAIWRRKSAKVEQLEYQLLEARSVIQGDEISEPKVVMQAATLAAQQTQGLVNLLQEALSISESNCENANKASKGTKYLLSDKQRLVNAGKQHLNNLLKLLNLARQECEHTKAAAQRAKDAVERARSDTSILHLSDSC